MRILLLFCRRNRSETLRQTSCVDVSLEEDTFHESCTTFSDCSLLSRPIRYFIKKIVKLFSAKRMSSSRKYQFILLSVAFLIIAVRADVNSDENEKPAWTKKKITDYSDADMERLLDQWNVSMGKDKLLKRGSIFIYLLMVGRWRRWRSRRFARTFTATSSNWYVKSGYE